MTDAAATASHSAYRSNKFRRRLKRRHAYGTVLRFAGMAAVVLATGMLLFLLYSIASKGYSAFLQTNIRLDPVYEPETVAPGDAPVAQAVEDGNYRDVLMNALTRQLGEPEGVVEQRQMAALISNGASYELRNRLREQPELVGSQETLWLPAASAVDMIVKDVVPRDTAEEDRNVSDRQLAWMDELRAQDRLDLRFNWDFLTNSTSRNPQLAGIWGATVGSIYTLLVTIAITFPIAIAAAVYLEEFAPRNRWTELIEININNLAAVPSIIYGLLGLAVFLNFLGMPRGAPVSGGVVLALMTLPIIIIAARSALKSVPAEFRQGALMMGASPQQAVIYGVLPVAMPGMLTGTIIGMAQALGETAPLLLMGMMAFIPDAPSGLTDSASVLPVQIYLWFQAPERGFAEKASAAIMILLDFLIAMNALAIFLRKRFEKRW